ncbi:MULTISPECIES: hypothetical protein [Haloarcula]|uniref:hypothetical protein n=1 Tax=Haloarcula TaxID=2237 RepID=UPI00166BE078|nr:MULTISPECIES: hypothetical protein [Halomicroarcula]MBX0349437.1 hypothetical protein [Halomicroarcula pellucida]MDS0278981.1 hypothetical protein [Halomicroarcula sp. S1AR25-4]
MRPPQSSLRSSLTTAVALAIAAVSWAAATARTATSLAWTILRGATARLQSSARTGLRESHRVLAGPLRRAVTGPVRDALLGRRLDISLLIGLLTVPLALGSVWWVDANVGYDALVELVSGTWDGTSPELGVFLAAAVLVGLGAVSAGLNSGLLPTSGLVIAPIFGAALTRYGTSVPTYGGGTTVVSLPEAVAYAAYVGVAFGVPIALCGFLLGAGLRRVGVVLTDTAGPSRPTEQA